MDKFELRRQELIKLLQERCGGKKVDLAEKLGRSDSYISRMLYPEGKAGKKRIGDDMVSLVAEKFDVDIGHHGVVSPDLTGQARGIFGRYAYTPGAPTITATHPDDEPRDDSVYIPESRIEFSAGNGRTAQYELVEEQEPATYRLSWFQKYGINPDHVRRFRVSGDSMEPMLFAKDTILVNLDETKIVDNKLYAIRYGDELRVKYLRRLIDGTLVLRSVNPAYDDEKISAELVDEHISIIGRVRDRSGTGGL
jgi:hypothetical protein